MTILWPMGVLPVENFQMDIAPRSTRAPSSTTGPTQTIASNAGIWTATLGNIDVRHRQKVLAFRAIAVLLEGMLNPILIPRCRGYQPTPDGADYGTVPHDDGTPFDDGTEYSQSVTDVVAVGSYAAGLTSMTVNVIYAGDIQPGQDFSIGERMYRIRSFDSDSGLITFRPDLREAVTDGAALEFDNPVCRMKLASDQEMNLDLEQRKFARPTIRLIEDA